jgi:hypothetical protein
MLANRWLIPVAALSKAWVCGGSFAGIVDCESSVLSGRGLCAGLITRQEKSYRVSRVSLSVIVKPRE